MRQDNPKASLSGANPIPCGAAEAHATHLVR